LQQRDITTSFERPQMEHYQKSGSVELMVVRFGCCNLVGARKGGYFKYSRLRTSLNCSEQFHRGIVVPWNKG
jgi:hypothetical protein